MPNPGGGGIHGPSGGNGEIGRISGPLLKDNLLRNGVDLAFETDLLYLDVAHNRIGIHTAGPTRDLTIVGTTNINQDLTVSTAAKFGNIIFGIDNYISTTTGNLTISANNIYAPILTTDNLRIATNTIQTITADSNVIINAAGKLNIHSNTKIDGNLEVTGNIDITQNLHVFGNLNLGTNTEATDQISFSGAVGADIFPTVNNYYQLGYHNEKWKTVYFGTSAIGQNIGLYSDGSINPNISNSDLVLATASTFLVEDLSISDSTITSLNNIITFSTASDKNLIISGTNALKIPAGSVSDRSNLETGDLRFSTTVGRYIGYGDSNLTFGGIFSDDRRTYIIPESALNENDKIINLTIDTDIAATINSTTATIITSAQVNKINIINDTISTTTTDANLYLTPAGSGSVVIGNLSIKDNVISNRSSANLTLLASGAMGYINFNNTVGLGIPSGDVSSRPLAPQTGLTRYNTAYNYLEIYNGSAWTPIIGASPLITASDLNDLTLEYSLLLGA